MTQVRRDKSLGIDQNHVFMFMKFVLFDEVLLCVFAQQNLAVGRALSNADRHKSALKTFLIIHRELHNEGPFSADCCCVLAFQGRFLAS